MIFVPRNAAFSVFTEMDFASGRRQQYALLFATAAQGGSVVLYNLQSHSIYTACLEPGSNKFTPVSLA